MRKTLLMLIGASALAAPLAGAQTRGLTAEPEALGGPVWQARFERDSASLLPLRGLGGLLAPAAQAQRLRLLGDYQFSALRLGQTGGLRLTGGLLLNLPTDPLSGAGNGGLSAQPYAGVGYASGRLDGSWGFSADLGLAGSSLGGWRADRPGSAAALGGDGSPRLLPMIRLGMSLAF